MLEYGFTGSRPVRMGPRKNQFECPLTVVLCGVVENALGARDLLYFNERRSIISQPGRPVIDYRSLGSSNGLSLEPRLSVLCGVKKVSTHLTSNHKQAKRTSSKLETSVVLVGRIGPVSHNHVDNQFTSDLCDTCAFRFRTLCSVLHDPYYRYRNHSR